MDVWIGVLAFVLFLGFATATFVCVAAIKRKSQIKIKSRLHRKLASSEVIFTNVGLIFLAVLLYFRIYSFAPAILALVLFIVLSTKIESGLTEEGAVIGTKFIEWEFMKSYKLVDEENSNIVTIKIRADRRQYVLVCERRDIEAIKSMFSKNGIRRTKVMQNLEEKES